MLNKLCIIFDRLSPPFDEGIKNIMYNLAINFPKNSVNFLSNSIFFDNLNISQIQFNKLFLNKTLYSFLKKNDFTLILYVPSSSLTFMSFLRAKVLKIMSPKSFILIMGLQNRECKFLKPIFHLLKPDGMIVLSQTMQEEFSFLNVPIEIFYPGVDFKRFCPVNNNKKIFLRKKYGFPHKAPIFLHVGHLKKTRNIKLILKLAENKDYYFCLVLSSTTKKERDKELWRELIKRRNIFIIDQSLTNIEEIYQLTDCYIFPVQTRIGATEVPLSVLEAMAVNLPVITTPYGALPEMFSHNPQKGFYFAQTAEDFSRYLQEISQRSDFSTREMVKDFSWEKRVEDLYQKLINWPGLYEKR